MHIRELSKNDCINYLELINTFKPVTTDISLNQFEITYDNIFKTGKIYVIEDSNKLIGTITAIIEHKFIHNLSTVCHVEDVIINPDYNKKGFGKMLVNKAIQFAKEQNCYKLILDCNGDILPFYTKCGLTQSNIQMEYRFS
jgi:glucosamine-phosphate N-acetyltransferase